MIEDPAAGMSLTMIDAQCGEPIIETSIGSYSDSEMITFSFMSFLFPSKSRNWSEQSQMQLSCSVSPLSPPFKAQIFLDLRLRRTRQWLSLLGRPRLRLEKTKICRSKQISFHQLCSIQCPAIVTIVELCESSTILQLN